MIPLRTVVIGASNKPSWSERSAGRKLGATVALWCMLLATCTLISCSSASRWAPELHVFTSGGFTAALAAAAEQYERGTGIRIVIGRGPSMGETPQSIPNRLSRHEDADVVILVRSALDKLAAAGQVQPGTVQDLGLSKIAVAVKAGAPLPDISTPDALRATLLRAKSVAWSDSASGVYIQSTMLDKLGIAAQLRSKGRMIPATPVGEIVADGEAEIGFQQLSELKPIKGIQIVGLLPESLQKVTRYSAGIVSYCSHPAEARAFIEFLTSAKVIAAIRESGLEPVGLSAAHGLTY